MEKKEMTAIAPRQFSGFDSQDHIRMTDEEPGKPVAFGELLARFILQIRGCG
jgi:hypothetical protein